MALHNFIATLFHHFDFYYIMFVASYPFKMFVWVQVNCIWQWSRDTYTSWKYWVNVVLNSKGTKCAMLWEAVPDGGPMSLFCLICSLPALSPGCYCWCPTNSAPAHSGGGTHRGWGCPFISILISPCWGNTNWKAVVTALTSLHTTGSGTTWDGEWACRTSAALKPLYPRRVTFSPIQTKTGAR